MTTLPDCSDLMKTIRLFVYGTLKKHVNRNTTRNNRFHSYLREYVPSMKNAYLLEDAYFFELIKDLDVSLFPGIYFDEHAVFKTMHKRRVYGEVYEVPAFMLTILANIEGSYFSPIKTRALLYEATREVDVTAYVASKEGLLDFIELDEIGEVWDGRY